MASALEHPLCTICSVEIVQFINKERHVLVGPSRWYPDIWKSNAIAISGPHWPSHANGPKSMEIPSEAITCQPAAATWLSPRLQIVPNGETVTPQFEDDELDYCCWYFGIHAACKDVANRVSQTSWIAHIRSIGDRWMTLDRQCTKAADQDMCCRDRFLPGIPENRPGEPIRISINLY